MKLFVLFAQIFSFMFVQQPSKTDLLVKSEWKPVVANHDQTVKKGGSKFTHVSHIADATSYIFNADGSFKWDDNPSCGTNSYATEGKGTWKLTGDILILDFKNTMTEQKGKRKIEKYKLVLVTEDELMLLAVK